MLKDEIRSVFNEYYKNKDTVYVNIYRNMLNQFSILEKSGKELTEKDYENVLYKWSNQRRDSIDAYLKVGKTEEAKLEQMELDAILKYLPKSMTESEIRNVVLELINTNNFTSKKNMGKLIQIFKENYSGQDGKLVSDVVREELSKIDVG